MSRSVPILMYHLVSPNRIRGFEKYTVAPKNFAAQMSWLARMGYTSITLNDGYRDCIDYALPILEAAAQVPEATFVLADAGPLRA
jgi:hypothetical protein